MRAPNCQTISGSHSEWDPEIGNKTGYNRGMHMHMCASKLAARLSRAAVRLAVLYSCTVDSIGLIIWWHPPVAATVWATTQIPA